MAVNGANMRSRTISIPVAEVIEGGTKAEFYCALRRALDFSFRSANKVMSSLIQQDKWIWAGAKSDRLDAYGAIKSSFEGMSEIAATISRSVEKKYNDERFDISRGKKSIPSFRSFPWPLLSNKSKTTLFVADTGEVLHCRLKIMNKWWVVRLCGGSSYRDQIKGLRNAMRERSESMAGRSDLQGHKNSDKVPGIGDSKISIDKRGVAVIRFSSNTKDKESIELSGELHVKTALDSLLVASRERDTVPFVINGDHVKRFVEHRDRTKQRLMQDRKSGSSRAAIKQKMTQQSEKNVNRLKSIVHEVSSQVVSHAVRRRVKTIVLDMTIKSYITSFPWFDLASKIEYKCADYGIEFRNATLQIDKPEIDSPHIYFAYAPICKRVKIGKSTRAGMERIQEMATGSPEDLIVLAVDNQPKKNLTIREKQHHAYFRSALIDRSSAVEWFDAKPVIAWLREVGWFGNCGNLSQLKQVIDIQ